MTRKIKYKMLSRELEEMVRPSNNFLTKTRHSIGFEEVVGEFFYISLENLIPFTNQARKYFNKEEILNLAQSIKLHGVRQPLSVIPNIDGKYQVISGERRLQAAKFLKMDKVPCIIVKDRSDINAIALIENLHRKDLHPVELGAIFKKILDEGIYNNQHELSKKIAISNTKVSEYLRYASLPDEVQKLIVDNNIFSRDKLRLILKSHENSDLKNIKHFVPPRKNFSVLRVNISNEELKYQDKGLRKLSNNQKSELKKYILSIMSTL